jgi:hypothetical protein
MGNPYSASTFLLVRNIKFLHASKRSDKALSSPKGLAKLSFFQLNKTWEIWKIINKII